MGKNSGNGNGVCRYVRAEMHSCKQKVVKDAKLNPHQSITLVNGCALQIDIIALHVHASLVFALFPYISH